MFGEKYELKDKKIDIDNAIIIDNIDLYILSLCRFNLITLLENENNRFYTKGIKTKSKEDNYINVNFFADDIVKRMVGDLK